MNTLNKIYWTIGEVSERLNVPTSRIRFWCNFFGVLVSVRRGSKNRKFNAKEVEKLKIVWYLVSVEKYTLEGTKRQLIINGPKWTKIVKNSTYLKNK